MNLKEFEKLEVNEQQKIAEKLVQSNVDSGFTLTGCITKKIEFYSAYKNVNHFTWGQWVAICELISEARYDTELIRHMLLIFHWKDLCKTRFDFGDYDKHISIIDGADIVTSYSLAMHYKKIITNQIEEINEKINLGYTEDQELAGVRDLEQFGSYNTLKTIGEQFHTKPSNILKWDFLEVYMILKHNTVLERIKRREINLMKVKQNGQHTNK